MAEVSGNPNPEWHFRAPISPPLGATIRSPKIAMSEDDPYRKRASEFEARAEAESIPAARAEWMKIASAYYRLADLADQNPKGGLVVDFTLPEPHKH